MRDSSHVHATRGTMRCTFDGMRALAVCCCMVVASGALAETPGPRPRLVVNELQPLEVSADEAAAMGDAVVTWLSHRELFEVVGPRDLQTLVGAERQRELLGVCAQDSLACSLDLSKLLSARFVLSGQLAKVGSAYQLTLQMVDTQRSETVGRTSHLAGSLEALRQLVPWAAAEATGSPLPPPPSRALPITLLSVGGAAVLAGGVVGLLALSHQAQLNDELCPSGPDAAGRCTGVNLQGRAFYVAQQDALTVQKVLSVSLMGAGAVLLGLGVWLMPADDARTRVSLRLVPTPGGLAFAGGFW